MNHSFISGAVSNCWAVLLPASSLEAECRRGLSLGFRYVELRQRALGDAEERVSGDERPWPIPDRLAELARSLPELGFNLAVEAPFMTTPVSPDDPYLRCCAEAAKALGGSPPVLRLVDVSPAPALLNEAQVVELGRSMARLAEACAEMGVRLALENSKQPVSVLQQLMRHARAALNAGVSAPRLCWDAHNQVSQTFMAEDPLETARTVPVEELFEFHYKQVLHGQLQQDVADGELDWAAILRALAARGYRGPALFEIPPGPDVWERLERSNRYIHAVLSEISRG
jgi:sugar phosphate isomerase/epimerase